MPFDAFFLTAVRRELEGSLTGCRIDKVQQPQRDTLILSMRGAAGGGRLLLTASPNHPRIHLTNEPTENPAQHGESDTAAYIASPLRTIP